jgi:hypothetical protein
MNVLEGVVPQTFCCTVHLCANSIDTFVRSHTAKGAIFREFVTLLHKPQAPLTPQVFLLVRVQVDFIRVKK